VAKAIRARRWRWLAAVAGFVAVLYAGSYLYLSRRGMAEAEQFGAPFFFYVPMEEVGPVSPGLARHWRLRELYAPANHLDRALLGGGTPCGGITWGLSGEPHAEPRHAEPGAAPDPRRKAGGGR
jgi:hypothetical protein